MISRRAFVLGAVATGCSRSSASPTPAPSVASLPLTPTTGKTRLVEWTFNGPDTRVVVVLPDPLPTDRKLRTVIALHGRGESLKAPAEGAMGWPRDYALTRAYERVCNPPLTSADFEGLVEVAHLEAVNRRLAERRFGGLAILCPYLPDIDPFDSEKLASYGRYLVDEVLGRAKRELPIFGTTESVGIDGVSHGGIVAWLVGLARTDVFAAVGALQPAFSPDKISGLVKLASAARAKLPKLRLTTSHDDYFRAQVSELSASLDAAGVVHDFSDLPGPHDYAFNRGPGSMELLLWHDRVLSPIAP